MLHQRVAGREFQVLLRPVADGSWTAECLNLQVCIIEVSTDREAIRNIQGVIKSRLEQMRTSDEGSGSEGKDRDYPRG
jgi:hypothetical protein